tara:strand:- start:784 stop:1410 length:627 start_codon:yes stop_codon:yes gene_type:complete
MNKRLFNQISIKQNGLLRGGYRLHCRDCPATTEMVISGTARALPPEFVKSKFSQRGWVVADAKQRDVCPACSKQKSIERRGNVVALTKPAADKPREMTREDKRLVFGKIDAVYLDERRGYENGWSDKRVADDLGVPLAWVRAIREADFGQEGISSDAREVIAAAKKLGEEIDAIDKRFAALTKDFADIKFRYARTERSVEDVRKLSVA